MNEIIDNTKSRSEYISQSQSLVDLKRKQQFHSIRSWEELLIFFRAFLRSPTKVGSIVPSSRYLAKAVIKQHNFAAAKIIVELGPGTGAITKYVIPLLKEGTLYVAIEIDREACSILQKRWPQIAVHNDSAENIKNILTLYGVEMADIIISGIPWGAMSPMMQEKIMIPVKESLRPNGTFTTYAYFFTPLTYRGRNYHNLLKRLFREVKIAAFPLRNLPPAIVYLAVA